MMNTGGGSMWMISSEPTSLYIDGGLVEMGVYKLVYTNCGLPFWALGVLENWWGDIRFGGVLLGVMSGSNYFEINWNYDGFII
jgi:hypothetical protein